MMRKNAKKAGAGIKKYTPEVPVIAEAMEKKRGGRANKKDMKAEGCADKGRVDKRARGGRTGSSPFSAAASTSSAKGHTTPDSANVNGENA
jgi:hypothetical protein